MISKKRVFKKISSLRLVKQLFIGFLALIIIGLVSAVALFAYYSKDLPDLKKLTDQPMTESTKIYDRTGTILLYDVYGEEKRTVISFEDMSQSIKDATIAIEDVRFYTHNGIDIRAIFRAILADLMHQKLAQGGSTITQQLVKKYFLTSEKTFSRKIKEAVVSLELEKKYSKNEILGFYLNQVPYGANAYGIESASLTFFNKRAKDLTIAESALLASLPKGPSYYNPYGPNKDALLKRKDYVLERMFSLGFISEDDYKKAQSESLVFAPQKKNIKAPHFVMHVKDYLETKYGEDYILKNGLKVYTTLNWDIQQIAEKIVYDAALKNNKDFGARNAALAAVDVKTGQILSMVGSYDYFDISNDGNVNVTTMQRQPGSSFKPFAYAAALEKGFTPETVVFDLPTEFSSYTDQCPLINIDFSAEKNNLCYHPQNYDGRFRGPVDLRHSLAQSLNIPSVKALYLAGIKETVDLAKNMGISSLEKDGDYGLSIVLGSAEVRPLDMASAYSVFANDGIKNQQSSILKIEDSQGKILEEYKPQSTQVLDMHTAREITSILSDNTARAPVFGDHNHLYLENLPTAAKTGTTQDYKDAWVVGYSPDISVAVWVGNNNGDKISKSGAGVSAAGPIWNKFMRQTLEKFPPALLFPSPEPRTTTKDILNGNFEVNHIVKIDKISQKLATENTPPDLVEEASYKEVHSILYFIDKNNPQGDTLTDPKQDPQFLNWELPVLEWVKQQNLLGKNYNQPIITDIDNIHIKENIPQISINSPQNNESVTSQYLSINTSILSAFPIKQVDFFIDDQLLGSLFKYPYTLNFPTSKIALTSDFSHILKVIIYDIYGNRNEQQINIFIPVTQ